MRYYFKKGGATSSGGSKAAPAAAPAAKAAAPAAKSTVSTNPAAGIKSQRAALEQKREDKSTVSTNPAAGIKSQRAALDKDRKEKEKAVATKQATDEAIAESKKAAAKQAEEKAAGKKKLEAQAAADKKKADAADAAARKEGYKDAADKAAVEKAYSERIGAYQKERTTSGGKYVSDIARGADVSDLVSFKATGAAEIQAKADGLAKERNAAATNYNTQIKQKDAAIAAAEKSKDKTLLATLKAERAALVSDRDLSNKEYNAKIAATTGPKNSELSQFNAAIAARIKERQGIETQVGRGGKAAGLGLSGDELEAILTDPTKYGTLSKDYDPYLGQFKADPTRDAAIAATAVALAGKDPAKIAQYKQLLSNYYIQQGLDPLLAKDKADAEVETGVKKETELDTFTEKMDGTTDKFTDAMDGTGGGGTTTTGGTGGTTATGSTTTTGGAATDSSNPYALAQAQADQQASAAGVTTGGATTGGATTGGIMPAFYPPGLYQPVYSPYAPVTTTISAGGDDQGIMTGTTMSPAQIAQMRGLTQDFFSEYMAQQQAQQQAQQPGTTTTTTNPFVPVVKSGGIIRG